MKKIALMLAFFMSVGMLAGCNEKNSSDEKSSSASQVQENDNADEDLLSSEAQSGDSEKDFDENDDNDLSDEDSSQVQKDDEADEDLLSSEAQPVNMGIERGSVRNGVYTSDFANLKFTAPEGWEFASDEYIASMMNISLEVTGNNNDLTKTILEQTTIYDALCKEQSTGKNILIMYENIAKEVPDPTNFTVDDYVDAVEKQFDSMTNLTFTKKSSREYVIINGEEYLKQVLTVKYDQMNYETEQIYYARKVGNFMLAIIASSGTTSDDMSVYEKNFEN